MNVFLMYIKSIVKEIVMNKLKTIVKVLDEKLANDITVIDMSIDSPICDYFVIASASNERLLLALKDHIEEACDKEDSMAENGYEVRSIEGRRNSKWLLMDYGDIIVHLFDTEERKNYGIEKLWSDKPVISIEDIL